MAVRTDAAKVAGIIEVDASIDLAPFILTASAMVTAHCTGANGPTTAYDSDTLELIERWLSAHVYATRDPRYTQERADVVGASYQSSVALGLNNSHYGQQAMMLDWNGGLARLSNQMVTGKTPIRPRIFSAGNQPPVEIW